MVTYDDDADFAEDELFYDGDDVDSPTCRECGCHDEEPCETEHGFCFWLEPNLCSACSGSPL